jgi:N-acetyl-anhydromuramyl-L-alanine amidase AmpD
MSALTKLILLVFCIIFYISLAEARTLDTIVVHTTDAKPECGAKCVDEYHKSLGWDSCGYHYIVLADGTIEPCRELDQVGAHVKDHNETSIGIAWAGNDVPTEIQKKHLFWLVKVLKKYYNITEVKGHNEYNSNKTCPKIDISELKSNK